MSSAAQNKTNDGAVVFVQLTSNDFRQALQRFVEENKPDPISKRQIDSLVLEWIQTPEGPNEEGTEDTLVLNQPLSGASHILKGKLKIRGTYMEVVLDMECSWKSSLESQSKRNASDTNDNDSGNDDLQNQKYGTLYYRCRVDSSTFVPAPAASSTTGESSTGKKEDKKLDKSQRRVHDRMIKRLKGDSYISKYLMKTEDNDSDDISILANARIHNVKGTGNDDSADGHDKNKKSPEIDLDSMIAQIYADAAEKNDNRMKRDQGDVNSSSSTNKKTRIAQLEERVDVSEEVAEAVRRAVWSSSESSLDVVEFILSMPSLPAMNHNNNNNNTCTPLADRAKLRLLEDAMLDACEREGEDGLLEDLSITNNNTEASEGSKRGKKSRTHR